MDIIIIIIMCVCVCVYTSIVRNKLICGYASVVHTSSSFHPHTPVEDCKTTGLKVDIAVWSGGHLHYVAVKDLILGFSWTLLNVMSNFTQ